MWGFRAVPALSHKHLMGGWLGAIGNEVGTEGAVGGGSLTALPSRRAAVMTGEAWNAESAEE